MKFCSKETDWVDGHHEYSALTIEFTGGRPTMGMWNRVRYWPVLHRWAIRDGDHTERVGGWCPNGVLGG
ncbi:hypothetical protein A5759_02960 [Mycobacterium sp. 852014-52144_SCH5372336]|nr:hypothetical protein A5759_02960 [Mycobacterium sp. 852014-52144_SCH5372336]